MLCIENLEFFRIDRMEATTETESSILLNFITDHKDIVFPPYKTTPFATFLLSGISPEDREDILNMSDNDIVKLLNKTNFTKHSAYDETSLYSDIINLFKNYHNKIIEAHTLIFKSTNSPYESQKTLLLAGIPCRGTLHPMKKSEYHKMYNGSFISLKNRPFTWSKDGAIYDKLIYLFVEIDAYFTFTEFVYDDEINELRRMNLHHFAINTTNTKDINTQIFVDELDIVYNRLSSVIVCENSDERNELFSYFGKGLFALSDLPENLTKKGNMLSVKIQ